MSKRHVRCLFRIVLLLTFFAGYDHARYTDVAGADQRFGAYRAGECAAAGQYLIIFTDIVD